MVQRHRREANGKFPQQTLEQEEARGENSNIQLDDSVRGPPLQRGTGNSARNFCFPISLSNLEDAYAARGRKVKSSRHLLTEFQAFDHIARICKRHRHAFFFIAQMLYANFCVDQLRLQKNASG